MCKIFQVYHIYQKRKKSKETKLHMIVYSKQIDVVYYISLQIPNSIFNLIDIALNAILMRNGIQSNSETPLSFSHTAPCPDSTSCHSLIYLNQGIPALTTNRHARPLILSFHLQSVNMHFAMTAISFLTSRSSCPCAYLPWMTTFNHWNSTIWLEQVTSMTSDELLCHLHISCWKWVASQFCSPDLPTVPGILHPSLVCPHHNSPSHTRSTRRAES